MALADYARNPLVYRLTSDATEVGQLVGNQLLLHLSGTLSLWDRLSVNLDIPFALVQTGTEASSPSGADFADVRLGLGARIWGDRDAAFQLAVGGYLWLPTGTGSYVTDSTLRGLPQLLIGGQIGQAAVWSFAVGPEIRSERTLVTGDSAGTYLTASAGLGVLLGESRQLQIGPEVIFSQLLVGTTSNGTNTELMGAARYRFADAFELGAGLGLGLSDGYGTPLFRGLFMFAYSPQIDPGLQDDDGDGIVNNRDACPEYPGEPSEDPKSTGCPTASGFALDSDGDDVPDSDDVCPLLPGIPQGDERQNGCSANPEEEAALLERLQKRRPGSTGDADGDGVSDNQDACPDEKGEPSEVPARSGCPALVRVTGDEIVLLKEVQFDTNKASLRPSARAMIEQLAEVLLQHPEITRVEVQGHTDSRGTLPHNQELALERASRVRDELVRRSIAEGRLTVKAYGPMVPLAPNTTAAGRQRNRRVQFRILDRATQAPTPGGTAGEGEPRR
jgi:outer membrane protein OmpA-like peptidoglycan-associated protein